MFESLDPMEVWSAIVNWCGSYFWTVNTLYQGVIIIISFIVGATIYRITRKRISTSIDNLEIPIRIKRSLNNLHNLVMPLAALTALFLFTQAVAAIQLDVKVTMTMGIIQSGIHLLEKFSDRGFISLNS